MRTEFKNQIKDKGNLIVILPVLIFLFLTLPFLNTIPFLDGNIEFVKNYDFFHGGFDRLLLNWGSIHPPVKDIIVSSVFGLIGVSTLSYNIIGILLGVAGIVFIYFFCRNLLGKKQAIISSLLLATLPLYISVGLFSLNDYFLTIFVITSLYFYITDRLVLFSLFAAFSALSKETGILLVFSVYFVEVIGLFLGKPKKVNIRKIALLLFPSLAYLAWYLFLKSNGKDLWSDWNFSDVASRGTIYTIMHNLVSLDFLNKYAYQSWRQLFILNFNWVYWLTLVSGFMFLFARKRLNFPKPNDIKIRSALIICLFCLAYFLLVLTFQTYTIPRYALPVYPFLMIGVSWSLVNLFPKIKLALIVPSILVFSFLTLFRSADPISIALWGTQNVLGEEMYGVNNYLAGNDGLTYNIQYLKVAKKRTFYFNNPKSLVNFDIRDCHWIFLDPRNDIKTAKILSLDSSLLAECNIY